MVEIDKKDLELLADELMMLGVGLVNLYDGDEQDKEEQGRATVGSPNTSKAIASEDKTRVYASANFGTLSTILEDTEVMVCAHHSALVTVKYSRSGDLGCEP